MPNPYHDFSAVLQPYGSEALNNSLHGALNAFVQQKQLNNDLQRQLAGEAGKARIQAWLNLQDPIAMALNQGKLRMEGFQGGVPMPPGNTDLSSILQGNPYANLVMPQGGSQPSSMPSMPSMPSSMPSYPIGIPSPQTGMNSTPMSFNPLTNGNSAQGDLVQEKVKMGAFGPTPPELTSISAGNQISGNKSYAEQIGQAKGKQVAATSMLDNITKNLAADLKSHFIESAGGGPIKGRITGYSTYLGMSPATFGLKNTVRDSAIAYARDLAGGSQGVQRLFQAIGETIPQPGSTQDQAGTALLQMHLTAAQLQSGVDNLGLNPKDLSKMSDDEIRNILNNGTIDRQAETERFAGMVSGIQPTKIMGMEGQLKNPEMNPILQGVGLKNNPINQKFIEGKIYRDGNGNRAKYVNGKFEGI